jgi:uncharacterized membrane protein SpoIIM required for sporulation
MRETRFISQNKEKWLESETLLTTPEKDPEKLSTLFTQVVDDLSFSRTHYQNRSVRVYLNKIAREYFSIIYSHQRERKNRFKLFWMDELPQIIIFCRKQLLISLLIFVFAAGVGIFSAIKDPQFTSTILGDDYVAMTKANIEKGDPMAVYKQRGEVDMLLSITFNNLMVAFRTYVFGALFSVGTVAILLFNGIMVGCFQFFFIERGLLAESALTIWLHGTLEISSIILAGGAGLTLGSGLIFPGTYSRLQAFQLSAIRSLKLMIGITPIFILAAVIESFLTRYTEVPDLVRLLLIIISAAFILGYFVIYPWFKSVKGFQHPLTETRLPPTLADPIAYGRIKNNAEILKDTFIFYQKYVSFLMPWIVSVSIFMTGVNFYFQPDDGLTRYAEWWQYLVNDLFFALKSPLPIFILFNSIAVSLIIYRVFRIIDDDARRAKRKFEYKKLLMITVVTGLLFTGLHYLEAWGMLLLMFSFAVFFILMFLIVHEETNLGSSISRTHILTASNFGQLMGLQVILMLMSFSFLIVLSAPLLYMNTEILEWNFAKTDTWSRNIIRFIEMFFKIFAFNLVLPLLISGSAFLYFTLEEIGTACNLKRAITMVGNKLSKNRR